MHFIIHNLYSFRNLLCGHTNLLNYFRLSLFFVCNIYILLDILVCSIAVYFYESKYICMSKNLQRYYTLKCLIRDLLSNVFISPKFWLAKCLLRFSAKCLFFGQSTRRGHYPPTYQQARKGFIYFITLRLIFTSRGRLKKASGGRGDMIAIAYDVSKYHFIGLKHFISIAIG